MPSIGQPNRVYEVLNRKRGLTIDMIRSLHRNLGIPAESLTGSYARANVPKVFRSAASSLTVVPLELENDSDPFSY